MSVIHNISTETINVPTLGDLKPGGFVTHEGSSVAFVQKYYGPRGDPRLKHYEISELSDRWPSWIEIEYTMFLHHGMEVREQGPFVVSADAIQKYLDEKLPHHDVVVVYGSEYYALSCIPGITEKLWSRVLLPELRRLVKDRFAHMFHADRPSEKEERIDVKLYFMWSTVLPGISVIPWYDVNEYTQFGRFCKRLVDIASPAKEKSDVRTEKSDKQGPAPA